MAKRIDSSYSMTSRELMNGAYKEGDKTDFSVGKYDRNYLEDVKNLWREQYDPNYARHREILFKWLTEENPFNSGQNPYFLLFDKKKVIGMLGHMPLEFTVNGEKKQGYLSQDALLAENYRGKGVGRFLLKGVAEQTFSFAGAIWFNEPNYHLYLKSGWLDTHGFYPFLKLFDPCVFIEDKIKNRIFLKMTSRLVSTILKIREIPGYFMAQKDIKILDIEQFDDKYDIFFKRISTYLGIAVVRDQRYLNWKFVRKPFNNYKRYAAFDDQGELCGYMVIKKEVFKNGVKGKILDILVHPDKVTAFTALIHRSIEEFIKIRASYMEIVCTFPLFVKQLKKLGFIRSKNPQRFMVLNMENQFEKNFVTNINNWYLTYSDADGDAWEVDITNTW